MKFSKADFFSVTAGLHARARTHKCIWPFLGQQISDFSSWPGASAPYGRHRQIIIYRRDEGTHPNTMDISSETTTAPLPPLTSKGFDSGASIRLLKNDAQIEACVTQWEKAFSWCELAPLANIPFFTPESSTVFIIFHADKHNTLSLVHGWDWTQVESLVPTAMNDAWLGCISGSHYTAAIWYIRWFISVFTRGIFHGV